MTGKKSSSELEMFDYSLAFDTKRCPRNEQAGQALPDMNQPFVIGSVGAGGVLAEHHEPGHHCAAAVINKALGRSGASCCSLEAEKSTDLDKDEKGPRRSCC